MELVTGFGSEGVSLSQLPANYLEKYKEILNFENLGYSKLKALVTSIEGIILLKNNHNHIRAVAKGFKSQLVISHNSSRK